MPANIASASKIVSTCLQFRFDPLGYLLVWSRSAILSRLRCKVAEYYIITVVCIADVFQSGPGRQSGASAEQSAPENENDELSISDSSSLLLPSNRHKVHHVHSERTVSSDRSRHRDRSSPKTMSSYVPESTSLTPPFPKPEAAGSKFKALNLSYAEPIFQDMAMSHDARCLVATQPSLRTW